MKSAACAIMPRDWKSRPATSSRELWWFLEEVRDKLILVQMDREHMQQKARRQAFCEGRPLTFINNLEWFDYSDYKKKYV